MPLPAKFYNIDNEEVTLEQLCNQEPEWAANRIRHLTGLIDKATNFQPNAQADELRCGCHMDPGAYCEFYEKGRCKCRTA